MIPLYGVWLTVVIFVNWKAHHGPCISNLCESAGKQKKYRVRPSTIRECSRECCKIARRYDLSTLRSDRTLTAVDVNK